MRAVFTFLRTHRVLVAVLALLVLGAGIGGAFLLWGRKKPEERFELKVSVPTDRAAFSLAMQQSLGAPMRAGHEVRLLTNGTLFDALEADIRGAKSSIHVVLYIWEKGVASDRIVPLWWSAPKPAWRAASWSTTWAVPTSARI